MPIANEIKAAISEFQKAAIEGCSIDAKPRKDIYAQVRIDGWPTAVHYEFRYAQKTGLYVELHAEHKRYAFLSSTFSSCAESTPAIEAYPVRFSEGTLSPGDNQKRWPSLSISLGLNVDGRVSASVMTKFITSTRLAVSNAGGSW